jgi:membrane protein
MRFGRMKRVVVGVANDIANNHIFAFAAALSYYFVLAFFPALIALAALVGYLPIPDLFDTIINTIARVVPPQSMGLIDRIVKDVITPHKGTLLSFGLLGVIWTCSSGFSTLIEALDVAYDVPETRSWWKTRLLSIELVFVVGTLIALAFAFMVVGPEFGEFLASHIGLTHVFAVVWPVLRYIFAVGLMVVAVEGIYFMAPNVQQRFRSTLPGAILAIGLWILFSDLLSLYFRRFAHLNRTYGVLGGAIALLVWLYWSGFIILLGAELNSEILQQSDQEALPLKELPLPEVKPVTTSIAGIDEPVDEPVDPKKL